MGCQCHIIHNTAGKAGETFHRVTGFSVDDMLVDIFYWFDKSTKRKASLQEYCEFCDTSYRTIIKHVNTRWLSLERAVSRTLQQYAALRSYFQSEHDNLFTGMVTKTHLRQLLDSDVSPSQASKYYKGVRAFYETAW
ncbi:uncharacterized protein LOC117100983, partial [Anneissia japonica]|uniref:uncharacterized protein LOC117100983 n=1 Tax=Anneissia japonica TaxID=1529436 RepID=UPI0014254F74